MYQKFTHFCVKEMQYFQLYNIGKVIKKVYKNEVSPNRKIELNNMKFLIPTNRYSLYRFWTVN